MWSLWEDVCSKRLSEKALTCVLMSQGPTKVTNAGRCLLWRRFEKHNFIHSGVTQYECDYESHGVLRCMHVFKQPKIRYNLYELKLQLKIRNIRAACPCGHEGRAFSVMQSEMLTAIFCTGVILGGKFRFLDVFFVFSFFRSIAFKTRDNLLWQPVNILFRGDPYWFLRTAWLWTLFSVTLLCPDHGIHPLM